ncbi:MAG: hypothetical protein LQ344_004068 [Seirophora lacunosa]|nr:MAG: hypothetical protein LQ344_004068 [Seirophora lacunosa]
MLSRYVLPYLVADALFVATGGLLLAVILMSKSEMNVPTTDDVTPHLLLAHAPLNGLVFDLEDSRQSGDYVEQRESPDTTSATGEGKENSLFLLWTQLSDLWGQWQCCGYMDIPFHSDSTCPTPIIAMSKTNCVGPFSNYANDFLDVVFTAIFGMVGMILNNHGPLDDTDVAQH